MRRPHHVLVAVTVAALAAVGLGAGPATAEPVGTALDPPPTQYAGEIQGARYRVLVPADWNGTLVLFSHGHYPPKSSDG